MNETPATVRMIDGATAPAISNVFVNNACAVCTLQITGSFAAATVLVEGIVNVASNQWVTLAAFNLSDLSLEKNGADKAGIYQVGIEGILRVRMNVTEVTGGDITIAAQFGNATINQFSKTEASNLIPITAYDLAVAGGYTGTLEQFETDMGNSGTNAANAAASASAAAASAESVSASAAQIATNTNDISDLKTQLNFYAVGSEDYDTFVSGVRSISYPETVTSNTARLTTGRTFTVKAGDKISVTGTYTGIKCAIAGKATSNYDSGWKTADFAYTVVNDGIYFVNVAKSDGTSSISPEDATISIKIIDGASQIAKAYDKVEGLEESVNLISSVYNFYDPKATYTQTDGAGASRNGYTINQDGSISCIRTQGSYGRLYLVDSSRTLKAGTYTISGKFTFTNPENTTRNVALNVGRSGAAVNFTLRTSRGGNTYIESGTAEGWFAYSISVAEDEAFAFAVMPWASRAADATYPAVISELMINEGSVLADYSTAVLTANDMIARKAADGIYEKAVQEFFSSKNLIGLKGGVLYPVHLSAGTTLTMSTADKEKLNTTNFNLIFYDIDKKIRQGKPLISPKQFLTERSQYHLSVIT